MRFWPEGFSPRVAKKNLRLYRWREQGGKKLPPDPVALAPGMIRNGTREYVSRSRNCNSLGVQIEISTGKPGHHSIIIQMFHPMFFRSPATVARAR
jgi:hypothetical protein